MRATPNVWPGRSRWGACACVQRCIQAPVQLTSLLLRLGVQRVELDVQILDELKLAHTLEKQHSDGFTTDK